MLPLEREAKKEYKITDAVEIHRSKRKLDVSLSQE
jgi:hypothetical protein